MLDRIERSLSPGLAVELFKDIPEVGLDSVHAYVKFKRDLSVCGTRRKELEEFLLPGAEGRVGNLCLAVHLVHLRVILPQPTDGHKQSLARPGDERLTRERLLRQNEPRVAPVRVNRRNAPILGCLLGIRAEVWGLAPRRATC